MHCVEFCDLYFGNFSLVNPALSEMEAILHQPGWVSRWPSRDATRQGITEAVADRWQDRRAGSSGNGGCRPQKQKSPGLHAGLLMGCDRAAPADQTSSKSSLANSALSEMNAKRASALVPISRSTESAVVSRSSASRTTFSMVRLAGSMVVSLSCAGIISPRPLKRLTSTLALALNSLLISAALCASSRA